MYQLLMFSIAFIISINAYSAKIHHNIGQELCSTEGLMRLIPELKNQEGKFQIPDPGKNPKGYLAVHTKLTNIIETALTVAASNNDIYQIANLNLKPLKFGSTWRSAEVGVQTDGHKLSFPDNNQFSSYGGISFMSGITKIEQGLGYYYSINKSDGSVPALVYVQPTLLACVNRVDLAAANTVGSWLTPTYALGNAQGQAYLVVDKCLDLGTAIMKKNNHFLAPNAILFSAIHWADRDELKHMRTQQKAHIH